MEETPEAFNPYAKSDPQNLIKTPAVPDFVTKTKEYVSKNPGMLREIAPEMFQQLNEAIDTAIIDVPFLGKVNVGEQFRKYQDNIFEKYPIAKIFLDPNLAGFEQDGKFPVGREISSNDGQGQDNEQEIDPAEDLSVLEQKEVIEFIADLSEQGFDNMRIIQAVRREWGIEYHPLTIKRMLSAYYAKPDPEPERNDEPQTKSNKLKVYQFLLDRNAELRKKIDEMEKASMITQNIPQRQSGGLLTRFFRWAI